MARVMGWSPTEMREREEAFAALVDAKVLSWTKWARAKVVASAHPLVAAGAPTVESVPAPPLDLGSIAAITGLWHGSVNAELMPALSEVYLTSASTVWQGIDEAFDALVVPAVSDSFAETYLTQAQNRLVAIGDAVWTRIRQELLTGFSLGESTAKLADRVSAAGQLSLARANVIARTEANYASNLGAHQQVQLAGLTGTKEWLDTNDERTRCTHRAAGGQTVDIGQPFKLGGPECGTAPCYLVIPGDPTAPPSETIQCRCSVAYDLELPDDSPPVVIAAAEVQTGAMIALVPQATDAEAMALDGGEPADQLHVTLLYLGDAVDWDADDRRLLLAMTEEIVAKYALIETSTFSVNVFNPVGDEFDTAVVLGVRGTDDLVALHESVVTGVMEVFDDVVPEQHVPWVPHITLEYTDELDRAVPEAVRRLDTVAFDRVVVAFGGTYTYYPLTGPTAEPNTVVVAAGDPDWDESKVKRDSKGKFAKKAGSELLDLAALWDHHAETDVDNFEPGDVIASATLPSGTKVRLITGVADSGGLKIIEQHQSLDGKWKQVDAWSNKHDFTTYGPKDYTTASLENDSGFEKGELLPPNEFDFFTDDFDPSDVIDFDAKPHTPNPVVDPAPAPTTVTAPAPSEGIDISFSYTAYDKEKPQKTWYDMAINQVHANGTVIATGLSSDGKALRILALQDDDGGWYIAEEEFLDGKWQAGRSWYDEDSFVAADLSEYAKYSSTGTPPAGPTPTPTITSMDASDVWNDVGFGKKWHVGDVVLTGKQKKTGADLRITVVPSTGGAYYLLEEVKDENGEWQDGRTWHSEGKFTSANLEEYGLFKTGSKVDNPPDSIIPPGTSLYTGGPLKNGNRDKIWSDVEKGMYSDGDVIAETLESTSKNSVTKKMRLVARYDSLMGTTVVQQEWLDGNGVWHKYATYPSKSSWDKAALAKFGIGKPGEPVVKTPPTPTPTPPATPKKKPISILNGVTPASYWDNLVALASEIKHGDVLATGTDADGNHWRLVGYLDANGNPYISEQTAGKYANPTDKGAWTPNSMYFSKDEFSKPSVATSLTEKYGFDIPSGAPMPTPTPAPTPTSPTVTVPTVMPTGPGTHHQLWEDLKAGKFKDGQVLGTYTDENGSVHDLVVTKTAGKWGLKHRAITKGGSVLSLKMWQQGKLGEMEGFVGTDLSKFKKPVIKKTPAAGGPKSVPTLTNAVIYGKYADGEVIATLGNPDLTKNSVQVRIIFENGKIKKQANVDGAGWKTVQTMGKGEAYKNLKEIDGPWYLGVVDAPGTGGDVDEGEPLVTSLPFTKPVATPGVSKPTPTSSGGISLTPTTGTAAENTHLGLWQKVQAGGFAEGEVIGSFSTGAYKHELHVEKDANGNWIIVHDKYGHGDKISVNEYTTTEDFLTGHIMDFQKPGGGKLVLTLPQPKKMGPAAVVSGGGPPAPVTPVAKKKVTKYFADKGVKWHTSSDTMLATAIEVQKDNPDLTLGQILAVMDETTKTKTSASPFTDKVKKFLGTAKGKQQFQESGLPSGVMSQTSSGTSVPGTSTPLQPVAGVVPTAAGHGIYHEGEHHTQAPVGGWERPSPAKMASIQQAMTAGDAWTPEEKKALKTYTASSTSMNNCLRHPDLCTPHVKKQTEQATAGMRPLPTGIRTIRGTGLGAFPGAEKIRKAKGGPAAIAYMQQQVGRVMVEPGFLSTSIGSGFGGEVRWEIDIPPGTPAAYVKSISHFAHEEEVLLPPGMKYRIKEVHPVTATHGSALVVLEVIYP